MEFTTKQLARLMVDNAKGKVVMPANFSNGEVRTPDEAISDAFLQIMELDRNATVNDIQLAFRKESVRLGVFAVIEEVIRESLIAEEALRNPFLDRFVETRSQARGDATVFYVESKNELHVSRISKDGVVSLDRQRFDEGYELEVSTQTYGIKVYEHLARIVLGRANWGQLVMALHDAVQKDMLNRIYKTFAQMVQAIPAGSFRENSQGATVGGVPGAVGAYSKESMLKVIRHVKAESGASSVILVGTELALANLQGAEYVDVVAHEALKAELHRTGKIGTWFGHELVEIPATAAEIEITVDAVAGTKAKLDDMVFVVPNNIAKPIKNIIEPELMDINGSGVRVDDTVEFAVRYSHGVAVIVGSMLGVVTFVPQP